MRPSVRDVCLGSLLVLLIASVPAMLPGQSAAGNPAPTVQAHVRASDGAQDEIERLQQQILAQKQAIERIEEALAIQQRLLEKLAAAGNKPAEIRPLPATGARFAAAASEGQAAATSVPSAGRREFATARDEPQDASSQLRPIPLKIGRATLTPFGFVDATAVFRTRNLGSGIGAAFGSLPFSNSAEGRLPEVRLTAQNSRFGLQYDSDFGRNQVRGYMETDFLGVQPSNAFVTSNSDSLRLRLYWADLTHGKFEFLAGQSWSLLTPGRNGISPDPSQLFYTQNMDTNYQVGLTWARQLQFRFVYHASPHMAAALSLENPEQYVGGSVALPAGFDANQVSTGARTSTPNPFPDVIGKLAFDRDPGGHHLHAEIAGLFSSFKTFSATSDGTLSAYGGGVSVNANYALSKNFRLFATSFYSSGGGRYLDGLAPDFVVRPGSAVSLVKSDAGIGGFEFQTAPRTMLFGYYGGVFIGRNYSAVGGTGGNSSYVGYGFPGASSDANRAIQEATFGVIRSFWKNQYYGALQLITQYSYLTRAPWYVQVGGPRRASLSEAYADIRYVIP